MAEISPALDRSNSSPDLVFFRMDLSEDPPICLLVKTKDGVRTFPITTGKAIDMIADLSCMVARTKILSK